MSKIDFESLVPELYSNNQTWMEFMEALADTIQEQIRDPIKEIEDIRHIVDGTDPQIVANTIKQLGFDIPADLVAHNADRLAKSVYMLSLFHERSGTSDFVKGIRFVLGRDVNVSNLYTNDYVNFYEEPWGPLIADGGDWYKTTHINLNMEILPSDANMVLPVGKTLSDRLMDAYFEFAPINHVVRTFYYTIQLQSTIGVAGKVVIEHKDLITIGRGDEVMKEIITKLPDQVVGGEGSQVTTDVRYDSDLCYDIPLPMMGFASSGLANGSLLASVLTDSLPSRDNQRLEVASTSGKYAYIAYPVALGRAAFVHVATGKLGGWDGAGWPASGAKGDSVGPIVVQVELEGKLRDYYLYRTDEAVTGSVLYDVYFSNAGRKNSCDPVETNNPVAGPELDGPDDGNEVDPPCVADMNPVYGSHGAGVNSNAEIEFLPYASNTDENQRISLSVGESQYGYFSYPIELGEARFIDVETGLEGGWGGASWAGSTPGNTTGPIVVVRSMCGVATEWYVYRTEMPNIGERSFDVVFDNPGEKPPVDGGDTDTDECVSGYPTFVLGSETEDVQAALISDSALVMPDTDDTTISVDLDPNEFAYFAYPVELGVAVLRNMGNSSTNDWDGASWPEGEQGETNGPIVIQREIAGKLYDWYLHRTSASGTGASDFEITFPSAGVCVNTNIAYPPTANPVDDPEEDPVDSPVEDRPCYVNDFPRFASMASLDGNLDAFSNHLGSTDNQTFSLSVAAGEYGWFAYPAALGEARFFDPNSGFEGGWDGASWPEDGSIGAGTGPIVVPVTRNNIRADWFLYRTDFKGLGDLVFDVTFSNPGVDIGYEAEDCGTVSPLMSLASASPSTRSLSVMSLSVASAGTCLVSDYPVYGSGNKVGGEADVKALAHSSPTVRNQTFSLTIPEGEYGWFAYPAALGEARFVDADVSIEGGWDGATWPEGSVEFSTGPVRVTVNNGTEDVEWLLYRTDFAGLGEVTFDVQFENNGLDIGDRIDCTTSYVPRPVAGGAVGPAQNMPVFGSYVAGLNTGAEVNNKLTGAMPDLATEVFELDIGPGEYGYFAHPAYLGDAVIEAEKRDVQWNGASWAADGSRGTGVGAVPVYRRINGQMEIWLLYRTDFDGLGYNKFRVTYKAATQEGQLGSRRVRVIPPVLTTDRPDIVSFTKSGRALFAPVYRDTTVHITSSFNGMSHTKAVLVRATGSPLEYIQLRCPSMVDGGDRFTVEVDGFYEDGHTRPIERAEIRILSQYVIRQEGYVVDTGNPAQDQMLRVEARYVDYGGNHHSSVRDLILKSVVLDKKVDELYILGPEEVAEGTNVSYRAHAFFNDGTQKDVLVLWESSSPGLYVDQSGYATAGNPMDNFTATLKATLQFRGQKYIASKDVEVVRNYITPESLRIDGPERVIELSDTSFRAFVRWSNGAETRVHPDWSTNRFSIDEEGVLTAGSVGGSVSVEIVARTQGMATSKVVSVYDTPVEIAHITIVGPENLREEAIGQYRAFAHFNDGRDVEVFPKWSVVGNPTFVQIDTDGRMQFTGAPVGIVEIKAEYDNNVKVFTQTKPIVLIPTLTLITGLVITGPSEVIEGERIHLQATAVYEDGTMEPVEPLWSIRSPDPLNAPEPEGDIVSPGIVQGRNVEQDTIAIVEARYFREIAEYPILVRSFDQPGPAIPKTSRINGPTVVPVSQIGSYSLLIEFDNGCGQELAVSNDWSLDVDRDVAIIDQNGFLRSQNGETVDVQVTASWECEGHSVEETITVRLLAEESTLGALVMYGSTSVLPQTFTQLSLELFRKGQPIVEGTGEEVENIEAEWSVETTIPYVTVSDSGRLYVGDVPEGTEFVVKAVFTEGLHSISTSKLITVGGESQDGTDNSLPMFGTGPIGLTSFEDFSQYGGQTMDTKESGGMLEAKVPQGEYLYYAHPAAMGLATFTDPVLGLSGGMEGATWPDDGGVGSNYGPLTITRTVNGVTTDWYLYRSDFSGLGDVTFRVDYGVSETSD
tara:strand:+ start:38157 stop:44120 length:5964 start_codon:yes stop_codon:yes gene_type:complete